jgi:hypothetical protein
MWSGNASRGPEGWGIALEFPKSGKTLNAPGQQPTIIRARDHNCAAGTP